MATSQAPAGTSIPPQVLLSTPAQRQRRKKLRNTLRAYLLLAPAFCILLVFHFLPIFYAFFLSLYRRISVVRGIVPPRENFAGLSNYRTLFTNADFWRAFSNTISYAGGVVIFGLLLALGIALLLDRVRTGRNVYRTAFFLPYITSLVAIGAVWKIVFTAYSTTALDKPNPKHPGGLLNWLFSGFGLPMQRWLLDERGILTLLFNSTQQIHWVRSAGEFVLAAVLFVLVYLLNSSRQSGTTRRLKNWTGSLFMIAGIGTTIAALSDLAHLIRWTGWLSGPSLALVCIILIAVWHSLGFNIVILLAGLTNVSRELYEAARIDGARGFTMFWCITVPLLSPTLFFLLIVTTITALQSFTVIYAIFYTSGNSTTIPRSVEVLAIHYYQAAFGGGSAADVNGFGYASTVVIFMLVSILALTMFQQRVLGKWVNYD